MFDKIKSAFSSLSQAATHTSLSKSDLDSILWDFEVAMIESDVSAEVIEKLNSNLSAELQGVKILRSEKKDEFVLTEIRKAIHDSFASTKAVDLLEILKAKLAKNTRDNFVPFSVLFLGINGTGKTTTVAKVANLLKTRGHSVVVACGDTHRPGAIEQLTEHAARLNIRAISQSYGADPAAVAKDAQLYAESHRLECVLIDSAGRMQTSKNLMEEMSKIVRVAKPDFKIFVGDSLAGNDALSQAKEFQSFTDFDATILTKADADVKGGAALSIAFETQRPIIYLGTGQGYGDLIPFHFENFVQSLFEKKD